MTALAANNSLTITNRNGQTRNYGLILTSAVCYHHALLAKTAAGLVKPCATETTTTFFGLCEVKNPTSAGPGVTGDGTLYAEVINNVDVQMILATAITVGNEGAAVFAADDQTVSAVTTGPEIGILVRFIAANSGVVRLGAKGPLLSVKA